jgi:hypothetical protein
MLIVVFYSRGSRPRRSRQQSDPTHIVGFGSPVSGHTSVSLLSRQLPINVGRMHLCQVHMPSPEAVLRFGMTCGAIIICTSPAVEHTDLLHISQGWDASICTCSPDPMVVPAGTEEQL